ncbi:MAG TPA: hypothetical protein VJM46_03420 [Candidatus Saccharimonadales bacterium]|nr:hypothetical protein [Candidatus Saccharimonadales bacterium]
MAFTKGLEFIERFGEPLVALPRNRARIWPSCEKFGEAFLSSMVAADGTRGQRCAERMNDLGADVPEVCLLRSPTYP